MGSEMCIRDRTFALHKRYGLALGAAMVYLPALTALHAARLVLLRSYDPETGGFDVRNLLPQRADRLLP